MASTSCFLGDGWSMEPRAQLIYQKTALDGGRDRFGLIDYHDTDAVFGRAGGCLVKAWRTDEGPSFKTWARVNVWLDFGSAATTFMNLAGQSPVAPCRSRRHMDAGGARRVWPGCHQRIRVRVCRL